MGFRGRVVEEKEINTPLGKGVLITTEYDSFPRRKKVIWWMGEMQVVELGELVTIYHERHGRKSEFEKLEWEPLYYKIVLNENADPSEIEGMFFLTEDVDIEDNKRIYEFDTDEDDKMRKFIEGLKCRTVKIGGVQVDSRAEFNRWKKALQIYKEKYEQ